MPFIQVDQQFVVEADVSINNSDDDVILCIMGGTIDKTVSPSTKNKRTMALVDPKSNSGEEYFSPMKRFQKLLSYIL